MTAIADPIEPVVKKKKSKMPLMIGLVLSILGGAGGYMAVKMGLLFGQASQDAHADSESENMPAMAPVAFVPLDPLIINLPNQSGRQFLRFAAQLEVNPAYQADIEAIKPRIVDVLNGYLRAVEVSDLEDPSALLRLRAQMLRRVQVVTGTDRVRDMLIMEFVLN